MNRADYDIGNLESEIKVQFEQAVTALTQTTTALNEVASSLSKIEGMLKNIGGSSGLKEISAQANEAKDGVNSLAGDIKKIQKAYSSAGKNKIAENIGDFLKRVNGTELSDATQDVNELREAMGKELGKTFVDDFDKALKGKYNKSFTGGLLKVGDALRKTINLGAMIYTVKKGADFIGNVSKASMDMIETQNLFEVQMGKVTDQYGNLDESASKYYTRAIEFQDNLNSKILTNETEMKKYQGMYFGMLSSAGINRDKAYDMSENLVKAGLDMSSLFNTEIDQMMSKLQSAITGQEKALREYGIDVTESSLQPILDDLGIDRSVQQLSYAEKEVARYIAIVQQAGQAQGDFARTFDSPANQLKMLKNQFIELAQVAGSFVINAFGGIIKYATAVVIAIKNVLKALASLFGFEISDASSSASSGLSDVVSDLGDVGSGLGNATKKAKEFKKQLMGFDEINNITPPSESSGGSGGGGASGGIDNRLLDALENNPWNMHLEKISDEINSIADSITNKIMPLITWIKDYADLVRDVVEAIGIGLATWTVAKGITKFFENMGLLSKEGAFKIAFGLTLTFAGLWLMYKGTKKLLEGDWSLENILETLGGMAGSTVGIATLLRALKSGGKNVFGVGQSLVIGFGITLLVQGFQVFFDGIKEGDIRKTIIGGLEGIAGGWFVLNTVFKNEAISGALNKIKGKFGLLKDSAKTAGTSLSNVSTETNNATNKMSNLATKVTSAVVGIIGMADSCSRAYESAKKFNEGAMGTDELIKNLGISSLEAAGSGASLGYSIGGLKGAIAGGVIGLVVELGTALWELSDASKEAVEREKKAHEIYEQATESYKKNVQVYIDSKNAIDNKIESVRNEIKYYRDLEDELSTLVDSNGHVTGSYDKVDSILQELNEHLGTNFVRNGDLITRNGKVVDSYKDIQTEIENTINALKRELDAEAYKQKYTESVKNLDNLKTGAEEAEKARKKYYEENIKPLEDEKRTYNEKVPFNGFFGYGGWTGRVLEIQKKLNEYWAEGSEYSTLQSNARKAKEAYEEAQKYVETGFEGDMSYIEKTTTGIIDLMGFTKDELIRYAKETVEEWSKAYDRLPEAQKVSILAQSTTLETFGPEIKQKWADLAQNSSTQFVEGIKNVDTEVASTILTSITTIDNLSPDMYSAWNELANKSSDEYNNALTKVDENTRLAIETANKTVDTSSPDFVRKWQEMATNSTDEYNKLLASMPEDTRKIIEKINDKTSGITPETVEAWKYLASSSNEVYQEELNKLPPETKETIEFLMSNVEEKLPGVSNLFKIFGEDASSNWDKQLGIMTATTEEEVQNITGAVKDETPNTGLAVDKLAGTFDVFNKLDLWLSGSKIVGSLNNGISSGKSGLSGTVNDIKNSVESPLRNVDSWSIGSNIVEGLKNGINSAKSKLSSIVKGIADSIPDVLKKLLKINSPSKVMIPIGEGVPEGLAVGIDKEASMVIDSAKDMAKSITTAVDDNVDISKLSQGISINPKDFEIDSTQFINYGAVKGEIQAQAQVSMKDNLVEEIRDAVIAGMTNSEVNVNIEAKTDEGVIFKKVQNSAREYTMQTGEPAFDY